MEVPKGTPKNPNQTKEALPEGEVETPKRRVRFLMVNPQDFLSLFTQGIVFAKRAKLVTGVPDDAKVVSMTVDHVRGGIILVVHSESYDEIPMTEMPPVQLVGIEIGVQNATKKKKK